MTALYLFASTFVLVFALGLQSLNVNGGHKIAAFITSAVIGAANLVLFKLAPNANDAEIFGFLLGGPFGIVAAMQVHPWLKRKWLEWSGTAIKCPGCDHVVGDGKFGGYRTYCEKCVDAIPEPPARDGSFTLAGKYPHFYWKEDDDEWSDDEKIGTRSVRHFDTDLDGEEVARG